jgi:hypothetical protein
LCWLWKDVEREEWNAASERKETMSREKGKEKKQQRDEKC